MPRYSKVSLLIATVTASDAIAAVNTGAYAAEGRIENDALAMTKAKNNDRHDCARRGCVWPIAPCSEPVRFAVRCRHIPRHCQADSAGQRRGATTGAADSAGLPIFYKRLFFPGWFGGRRIAFELVVIDRY